MQKDLRKLAKWCAKWRIKLNPAKTKVIIFSRSYLAGKPERTLKLYGERLKIYPKVKFLGITFDSKFTFRKHFEDILGHCNARYHRIRLLTNKKWGPSPSTIIQIYKQCVRPIFEYGSLSTITTSDTIISEIQWLQNKFIRLALCLPKYISVKLLLDSFGLPYVKDRLLSRATRTLERIVVLMGFMLTKFCVFACSKSYEQWYVFIVVLSLGKLDLSFVFMVGPKSANLKHTSEAEIAEENNYPRFREIWHTVVTPLNTHVLQWRSPVHNRQIWHSLRTK